MDDANLSRLMPSFRAMASLSAGSSAAPIRQISGCDHTDELPVFDDEQTADRSSAHEIRGLPQRGVGRGGHGCRRHDVADRPMTRQCRLLTA